MSTTVSSATNLAPFELGFSTENNKLYVGRSSGGPLVLNPDLADTPGTLPISKGGTGATTVEQARTNLGVLPLSGGTLTGNLQINGLLKLSTNAKALIYATTNSTGVFVIEGLPNGKYPTVPGVYRCIGTVAGMPSTVAGYGCLVIFNGGTYCGHIYISADGYLCWAYSGTSDTTNKIDPPTEWHYTHGTTVNAAT